MSVGQITRAGSWNKSRFTVLNAIISLNSAAQEFTSEQLMPIHWSARELESPSPKLIRLRPSLFWLEMAWDKNSIGFRTSSSTQSDLFCVAAWHWPTQRMTPSWLHWWPLTDEVTRLPRDLCHAILQRSPRICRQANSFLHFQQRNDRIRNSGNSGTTSTRTLSQFEINNERGQEELDNILQRNETNLQDRQWTLREFDESGWNASRTKWDGDAPGSCCGVGNLLPFAPGNFDIHRQLENICCDFSPEPLDSQVSR